MSTVVRIQLDFPEDKVRELDQLMKQVHISTRKDLFNNALTLLVWAVRERLKGKKIVSMDERDGSYKELVMPLLEEAGRSAEEQEGAFFVAKSGRDQRVVR